MEEVAVVQQTKRDSFLVVNCASQHTRNKSQKKPKNSYVSTMNPYPGNHRTIRVESCSPYENVDAVTKMWLDQLKNVWSMCKKSSATKKLLDGFFIASINPYVTALQAMVNSGDFYSGKQNSFAYFIMDSFTDWIEQNPNVNRNLLNDNIKTDAFKVTLQQKNQALLSLVAKNYRMMENKLIFVEPIRDLIAQAKYKEACQCALMLDLFDEFKIEDFVIPLVIQDKYAVAEKYIEKSNRHQIELVTFLDSLLGKRAFKAEVDASLARLNIIGLDTSRLYPKPLSKLVQRIVRTFNLPESTCPNLVKRKGKGMIHFLLNKRFVEMSIGKKSWYEMILEAVGSNKDLQMDVVDGVVSYGSLKEALFWARKFDIPKDCWPYALKNLAERGEDGSTNKEENYSDEEGDQSLNQKREFPGFDQREKNRFETEEENWDEEDSSKENKRTHEDHHHFREKMGNACLVDESGEENWDAVDEIPKETGLGTESKKCNQRIKKEYPDDEESREVVGKNVSESKPSRKQGRKVKTYKPESGEESSDSADWQSMESNESDNWRSIEENQASVNGGESCLFHRLAIDSSQIHMVQDVKTFNKCLEAISKETFVGIDAEWKPSFGLKKCRLSLFQVATTTEVYLIDLMSPSECLSEGVWISFYLNFLTNPNIIKVGFGIEGDLKLLGETLSAAFEKNSTFEKTDYEKWSTLDLRVLWTVLVEKHNFRFPHPRPSSSPQSWTLSTLVELCLGKKLDKADQFSNWENRPLRLTQRLYAALDAFCLLEIADIIASECDKQNIAVMKIVSDILRGIAGDEIAGEKVYKTSSVEKASLLEFSVTVHFLLADLGRELRRRGVNTVIFRKNSRSSLDGRMRSNTNSVFVTTVSDKSNRKWSLNGKTVIVNEKNSVDNQVNHLAREMNVDLPDEKTPSRCISCNSNEFIRYSKDELTRMLSQDEGVTGGSHRLDNPGPINKKSFKGKPKLTYGTLINSIGASEIEKCSFVDSCVRCNLFYWEGSRKYPGFVFKP